MHKTEIKRAPVSSFKNIRNSILFGKALEDIKQIERSISQFGMIMPITVVGSKNSLIVIDGKKRLTALKRMAFSGTLPRSLVTIPYLFIEEAHEFGRRPVSILSSQELYKAVDKLKSEGNDITEIARKLYLCRQSVQKILQIAHLCGDIKQAFFRRAISIEQAYAFSTMPCKITQKRTFMAIGPFAEVAEILAALKAGFLRPEEGTQNPFTLVTHNTLTPAGISQSYVQDKAA